MIGRSAAIVAIAAALIAVVVIVFFGGSSYHVRAIFQNASQIVSGDLVQVAGNPVGKVSDISLTPQGQAQLTLNITDGTYNPLRQGTIATVRQASLSGIANRYVDLRLGRAGAAPIRDGGFIPTTHTSSAVDFDQLFDTLDAPTRKGLQELIQGSASQYAGQGAVAQRAWEFLNPAVATSSMLFSEINRDTASFSNFVVKSGSLVSTLAQRQSDLSGLVANLATTTEAVAAQNSALGQSIQQLPGFMRLANTTFVNLRNALDDIQPLVDVTRPVAPKLQALLEQLRPLAEESVPTVRDLANVVSRPGPDNDLTDLTALAPSLAAVTVRNVRANGKLRPGAFPQSTVALNATTPELATARPYAVDLTGWFEGFSHPGTIDANGGTSRVAAVLAPQFSAAPGLSGVLGMINSLPFSQQAAKVLELLGIPAASFTTGQGDRCPGSMERGPNANSSAAFFPYPGFPCTLSQRPTGL